MNSTTQIIEEEVVNQVLRIEQMTLSPEERKAAVDTASKLADKMIDLKKLELEEKKIAMEKEEKMKLRAIELEKTRKEERDQKIKNGITIAGIVAPIVAAIWANVYNWRKETDGIMTSTFGKKAMDFLSRFSRR